MLFQQFVHKHQNNCWKNFTIYWINIHVVWEFSIIKDIINGWITGQCVFVSKGSEHIFNKRNSIHILFFEIWKHEVRYAFEKMLSCRPEKVCLNKYVYSTLHTTEALFLPIDAAIFSADGATKTGWVFEKLKH